MLLEAAHELFHAKQFAKYVARHNGDVLAAKAEFFVAKRSYLYAKHEVSAEKVARKYIEKYYGKLSTETLKVSDKILKYYREKVSERYQKRP